MFQRPLGHNRRVGKYVEMSENLESDSFIVVQTSRNGIITCLDFTVYVQHQNQLHLRGCCKKVQKREWDYICSAVLTSSSVLVTAVCLCWTAQQRKRLKAKNFIHVYELAHTCCVCTFSTCSPETAVLFLHVFLSLMKDLSQSNSSVSSGWITLWMLVW